MPLISFYTLKTLENLSFFDVCWGYRHSVKRVRIRSYSAPHFSRVFPHSDWIRRDTKYLSTFSPNAGKSGKNADQNNSEYGLFLRSERDTSGMKWVDTVNVFEDNTKGNRFTLSQILTTVFPLISAKSQKSASPLTRAAPPNAALIRIVTIFY